MATHKEALRQAYDVFCGMSMDDEYSDMEAALRAYLDAMDAVIVPKEPTREMIRAVHRGLAVSLGHAEAIAEAVLSAAPNPFKDEDNDR